MEREREEPKRKTAEITLFFGQLAWQLNLYRPASANEVGFKEFRIQGEEKHEVGRQAYDKATGEVLTREQITKGVKLGSAIYLFDDAEIELLKQRKLREIRTVRFEEATPVMPEAIKSAYYASPSEKALPVASSLILEYLKIKDRQIRFVMVEANTEREAVLKLENGTLMLYVLHYPDEIKIRPEARYDVMLGASLQDDFTMLAENMNRPIVVQRRDDLMQEILEAKMTGKKLEFTAIAPSVKSVGEMLKESLALVKR